MKIQELTEAILGEIRECLALVKDEEMDDLISRINAAGSIYVDGKGRSGMPAAGFAMRLGQMGMCAFVPSGVTTPPIREGDLLLVCSGSGETEDLLCHAQKAKEEKAQVVLITASPSSSVGRLADAQILLQARSKWQPDFQTIQPMGTTFEQGLEILFDALIVRMMETMQISNESMMARHNNLE